MFINGKFVFNIEFGYMWLYGDIVEAYVLSKVCKVYDLSWIEWGERFNEYLYYFVWVVNFDLIILGGGVSKKFSKYEEVIDVKVFVKLVELCNVVGMVGVVVYVYQIVWSQCQRVKFLIMAMILLFVCKFGISLKREGYILKFF